MSEQGFTQEQRVAVIEWLPADARERLGFYYYDGLSEWRHRDAVGSCGLAGCEYVHDAALLAEAIREMTELGYVLVNNPNHNFGDGCDWWFSNMGDRIGAATDIFTAVHSTITQETPNDND